MALAFDKISTVSTGTTSWNFDHTPVGTPRGAFVLISENASTGDVISGVTYGGVTMARVTTDADTSGEPGRVYVYFLGANLGTGLKQVAITVSSGTTSKAAVCITVTASYDTALAGTTGYASTNGDQANPSLSITGIGSTTPAYGVGVFFSGLNNPDMTAGSGYTQATHDFGTKSTSFEYMNSPTSGGNVTVNWTASSDDVAAIGVAIKEAVNIWEYAGTGTTPTFSGSATTLKQVVKTYAASGGATYSGAAATEFMHSHEFTGVGGITISGAATTSTEVLKIYDGSGGLTVSGAADAFFASIREVTGTGGVVLSGAGAIEQLKVPVVSGGIALTGSAIGEFMHSHEVVGSGGLVFTGDAALAKEVIVTVVASGGVVFSGVATVLNEVLKTYDGSGGVVFSGAAGTLTSKEWAFDGSGSLAFAGSGVYSRDMVFVPSGGLTLIGAAELTKWKVAAATGGVVLAGTGATSTLIIRTVSGAGGTIFGGSIEAAYEVVPTCSGGVVFSGAATIQWDPTENIEEYSGTGTITFSGAATTEFATTVTTIYPTTVVDASTYTRETGSSDPADLLAGLTSPDAYYDRSPTRPATTTLKVGFITLNARPGVMLYYEYGKDMADGERIDQTIDLRKAGAVVKTATHNDVGVRPISGEIDLSDLTLSGDYEVWLTDTEVV